MPTVGIDLGGTKLAAAVFCDGGELVHREIIHLSGRAGATAGALVAERARQLVAGHGCDAVGICVSGLYRATSDTVWAPSGAATQPFRSRRCPGIGGFVGFHSLVELPLTCFTRVTGEMGIHAQRAWRYLGRDRLDAALAEFKRRIAGV